MLEPQDLQAIAKLIAESEERTTQKIIESEERTTQKIIESEERTTQKIIESEERTAQKIIESEKRTMKRVDRKIKETEKFLLDEIDRFHRNLSEKISMVDTKVDNIEQYYKIRKMEDSTTSLLFEITEEHDKRISALEKLQHCTA